MRVAHRIAFSINSKGTGSGEMKRTERRAAIRSMNSREACNCSSGVMREKIKGTCLCDFIAG